MKKHKNTGIKGHLLNTQTLWMMFTIILMTIT